ncbi:MAG: hypothetical protein COC19_06715, partial [SAR86 cluster bacterium]
MDSLKPSDFAPLQQQASTAVNTHSLTRPSLSYWQDSWLRLKANKRALVSLYLVVALLLFTVVGPFIWTVDSITQDLDQVSQPPGTDRRAEIVSAYQPWDGLAS